MSEDYYVYAISSEDNIKIGYTKNIEGRLSGLQVGNPIQLRLIGTLVCSGEYKAREIENKLHVKFQRNRLSGEWFKISTKTVLENFSEIKQELIETSNKSNNAIKTVDVFTLYGIEEKYSHEERPRCYFYPNYTAQIMISIEKAVKGNISVPYRTMEFPTYGKQLLLPYSPETDRVFISEKKHRENMELNRYNKKQFATLLDNEHDVEYSTLENFL